MSVLLYTIRVAKAARSIARYIVIGSVYLGQSQSRGGWVPVTLWLRARVLSIELAQRVPTTCNSTVWRVQQFFFHAILFVIAGVVTLPSILADR